MGAVAGTIFRVRTGGSDTICAGGFLTGAAGTDYSQQDAAQFNGTDLAVDAVTNTKVTSASHNFVAADVGNYIRITAGTGYTAGFYRIVSVAANAATLDTSPAAVGVTGGTWYEGGAFASPGMAASVMVAGTTQSWQSGMIPICTSATPNIPGGCVALGATSGTAANLTRIVGEGTRPIFRADGVITNFTLITGTSNGALCEIENIETDGNNRTGSRGISTLAADPLVYNCKASNCKNIGFFNSNGLGTFTFCVATGCSIAEGFSAGRFYLYCTAIANAYIGFNSSLGSPTHVSCFAVNNTGALGYGFANQSTTGAACWINCVAYGNAQMGFYVDTGTNRVSTLINCVAVNNGTYGIGCNAVSNEQVQLINFAHYNNTTANIYSNIKTTLVSNTIALTADPFTNAAGLDFSLNSAAGGGALLRGLGFPTAFPGLSTNQYEDVGAAQARPVSLSRSRNI